MNAIKQKGLKEAYKKLVGTKIEWANKLKESLLSPEISQGEVIEDTTQVKALKTATAAYNKATESFASVVNQVFLMYVNLISEGKRQYWDKILAEQINCSAWTDLLGVEQTAAWSKKWNSFMECITVHLLMLFSHDAAEAQRYYISNGLKKPNRVHIRQFMQHDQQLNGYFNLLLCFFNSNCAVKLTKRVGPFVDANLVSHILHKCPRTWQA